MKHSDGKLNKFVIHRFQCKKKRSEKIIIENYFLSLYLSSSNAHVNLHLGNPLQPTKSP